MLYSKHHFHQVIHVGRGDFNSPSMSYFDVDYIAADFFFIQVWKVILWATSG